jgi:acetylornithine deacetylase/succinyl-diaminopimelate desuccinylase-like protein
MHKNKHDRRNRQSFTDFTEILGAKWRALTTSTPMSHGETDTAQAAGLEAILRHLVGIPTVTGSYQANHDALNYIERFLSVRGMRVTRYSWNNAESLVATTRQTKCPEVMLAAHLDVVPAEQHLFEVRQDGDKFYGRGTLDMKFAIASYLNIIDDLQNELDSYDIGIMITTDEEAGGTDGMAKLVEEGYLPKVCILPDGGDDWQIQTHAKGIMWLSITGQGKPAHASRPWLGENAIMTVVHTLTEVEKLFEGHNADTKTLNVGRITGGAAVNQVADNAEVLLDIRFMSEAEKTPVLATIQTICTKYGTELSVLIDGAVAHFSLSDPYIRRFADIVTEVTGVTVTGSKTLGSNDTRYLAKHNIPCISLYPPGGGHHGPDEWISKQGLYNFREITLRYIKQVGHKT